MVSVVLLLVAILEQEKKTWVSVSDIFDVFIYLFIYFYEHHLRIPSHEI